MEERSGTGSLDIIGKTDSKLLEIREKD